MSFTFERFEVTESEAQVVKRLLRLYGVACDNSHSRICDCELCDAIAEAGELPVAAFASLEDKVRRIV